MHGVSVSRMWMCWMCSETERLLVTVTPRIFICIFILACWWSCPIKVFQLCLYDCCAIDPTFELFFCVSNNVLRDVFSVNFVPCSLLSLCWRSHEHAAYNSGFRIYVDKHFVDAYRHTHMQMTFCQYYCDGSRGLQYGNFPYACMYWDKQIKEVTETSRPIITVDWIYD